MFAFYAFGTQKSTAFFEPKEKFSGNRRIMNGSVGKFSSECIEKAGGAFDEKGGL